MRKFFYFIILLVLAGVTLYYVSKDTTPSSSLFYGKRIIENFILATKIKPEDRADYYSQLLDVRLKELQTLYDDEQFDLIISASLRYSTIAGRLTETIKTHNLTDQSPHVKEQFNRHKLTLQSMADNYTEKDDRWKFIIDAKNYLDIYEKELP
ncbi:hypothetical protein A3A55_00490 [Candidatus Roizmanbacteria bacterium RIFCSPLOWO2_01_FULL_40_14]|uniref:DUF5667 domain-containing protein n=1 Tax=Candidatus Roizmanbacteria bacterium GW2011_GWA1_41_13 TaxID=1618474 RepID=A0A0G0US33_9BACT|nr:MAG: hypothetical protein UT85_C0007G0005 [Candidatus Levybacteria bacterium GW2011_GWA2_40_16]KKR91548.1 MAG: hypothetical protein UU41_C0035G0013 [Candidatus Roizmanbacteria bacterium GW2011_GWA1_41_13]OGK49167.1 MAG: hypothetical protein A3A55_00490 [Candidatus Roizmanbacteria bacterium RIFCSPLOWO2_01_FULL_40_14]